MYRYICKKATFAFLIQKTNFMFKKITNVVLLLIAIFPINSFAQNFVSKKKLPQVGASINLVNFPTTTFYNEKELSQGFSLMYWKGINNNVDYSVRYNGVFSKYAKTDLSNSYINELEGSVHGRLMSDNHLIQPFATLGLGVGNYSSSFAAYIPAGLGIQINMFSEGYLFLQANKRFTTNSAKLDDNMFYSLGYTVPLFDKVTKPKHVTPPPAPVAMGKDRDGDGVPDSLDECPDVKGLAALHGCPDKDADGIADKDDKCPDVAGVAKYLGCPIPDTDGDGINDEEDQCPTVAGTVANHGCPEVKAEIKKKIEMNAKEIYFTTASDKIIASSFKSLDEVADILKEDKNLKLDISGHTDNTGDAAGNKILSQQRAKAVFDYLVSKGIDAKRLTSEGYGEEKPVADNSTEEGKSLNRRVELKLKYY